MPGLFGHLPEWQGSDRTARDPRPTRIPSAAAETEALEVRYEFATGSRRGCGSASRRGRIEIETADVAETTVDVEAVRGDVDDLKVEQHGRDIVVESRKRFGFRATRVRHRRACPARGGRRRSNVASADVPGRGPARPLEVNTASGDVQVEDVERDARSAPRAATSSCRPSAAVSTSTPPPATSTSARRRRRDDPLRVGRRSVGEAAERVKVRTASGDIEIGSIAEGKVDVKSASGDVEVGIRRLAAPRRRPLDERRHDVRARDRRRRDRHGRAAGRVQAHDDERRHHGASRA